VTAIVLQGDARRLPLLSRDYCRLARWRTRNPGERARARDLPKPPPVPAGMDPLFDMEAM